MDMVKVLLLLFLSLPLFSLEMHATYRVEFGIFGEVARAKATLQSEKGHYRIDADVWMTSFLSKKITEDLQEHHISIGDTLSGLYLCKRYEMHKRFGAYRTDTVYEVDTKQKALYKHYREYKHGKAHYRYDRRLPYFGRDDLMTLFLNLNRRVVEKYRPARYRFSVVGADRKAGRVDVEIPPKSAYGEYASLLGKLRDGEWYAKVIMHRKLYHSKRGELMVKISQKSGMVERAVLKDIFFFGDVRIIRER